jgi:hypothetical protein
LLKRACRFEKAGTVKEVCLHGAARGKNLVSLMPFARFELCAMGSQAATAGASHATTHTHTPPHTPPHTHTSLFCRALALALLTRRQLFLRGHGLSGRRGKGAHLQPHHAWLEVCSCHVSRRNPVSMFYLCLPSCDLSPPGPSKSSAALLLLGPLAAAAAASPFSCPTCPLTPASSAATCCVTLSDTAAR